MLACSLCSLNVDTKNDLVVPSVVAILQQVAHALKRKDVEDHSKAQDTAKTLENLRSKLETASKENGDLKKKCMSLEESVSKFQNRSDTYKNKFLSAQDALEKLHRANQALSKKQSLYSYRPSTKHGKSFPFELHSDVDNTSNDKDSVVLAPDTCCTQSANAGGQALSLDKAPTAKPPSLTKRLVGNDFRNDNKQSRKMPDCSVRLVKCAFDPDETRLVRGPVEEDDAENFSIPSSPVLSGTSATNKKASFRVESRDVAPPHQNSVSISTKVSSKRRSQVDEDVSARSHDDVGSPSLLQSGSLKRSGFPLQKALAHKVSSNVGRTANSKTSPSKSRILDDDKDDGGQDSCVDFQDTDMRTFRGSAKRQKRSISPIECEGTLDVEPQEDDHVDMCTSIDELFDKTEGNLADYKKLDSSKADGLNTTGTDCVVLLRANDATHERGGSPGGKEKVVSDDDDDDDDDDDFENDSISRNSSSHSRRERGPGRLLEDSFNVIPESKKDPGFKFQSVVRKKDERVKLSAKSCAQCEAYYSDLSPSEREKALKEVCRHRHQHVPPSTPEHYWELGMPNTAECKRRGYLVDEEDLPDDERLDFRNRRRRRKPLQAIFQDDDP